MQFYIYRICCSLPTGNEGIWIDFGPIKITGISFILTDSFTDLITEIINIVNELFFIILIVFIFDLIVYCFLVFLGWFSGIFTLKTDFQGILKGRKKDIKRNLSLIIREVVLDIISQWISIILRELHYFNLRSSNRWVHLHLDVLIHPSQNP